MKTLSKSRRIVFIDDDKDRRRQWHEWGERRPFIVKCEETAMDANEHNADMFVFDISSVSGSVLCLDHSYAPIANVASRHPGALIVISSAVSERYISDVIDDIRNAT